MASRNQKLRENPVSKWYQWKTQYDKNDNPIGGTLMSYDKETEQNVAVELPFSVAMINDSGVCFKGYNEGLKEGVWSNEGMEKNHLIVLKNKSQGELMRFKLGDYQKVKDEVNGHGAKYTKVLYCAVKNEKTGEFELIGITLSGAGLTGGVDQDNFDVSEKMHGYFNATKSIGKMKLFTHYLTFKEGAIKKKGKSKFFVPVFEQGQEVTEKENKQLIELNDVLDEYHKHYYSNTENSPVTEKEVAVDNFMS
jgi:hypothetical protein